MADDKTPKKKRVSIAGVLLRLVFAGIFWAIVWGGINPDRAIPVGWNPLAPLRVSDPITPISQWRFRRTIADPELCIAALTGAADFETLPDLAQSEQCYIRPRVDLSSAGSVPIRPVETRCAIALSMAMWTEHSLKPAAIEMGTRLSEIDHIGSYNCRQMRTENGGTGRMSTHATASAIDISGFRFENGERIRLIDDWDGAEAKAIYLRKAKDGACDWFRLTLSPDYNALHADHFHLQSVGWGGCR